MTDNPPADDDEIETATRGTVLEVKFDAGVTAHLPLAAGDDVEQHVRDALDDIDELRHIDHLQIREVYPIEDW